MLMIGCMSEDNIIIIIIQSWRFPCMYLVTGCRPVGYLKAAVSNYRV